MKEAGEIDASGGSRPPELRVAFQQDGFRAKAPRLNGSHMTRGSASHDENVDVEHLGVLRIGRRQVLSARFVHEAGSCQDGCSRYLAFYEVATIHGSLCIKTLVTTQKPYSIDR